MTTSSIGDQVVEALHALRGRVGSEVPLGPFTTFGVGGPAVVLAEPASVEELQAVILVARRYELSVVTVGQGSNLLVADTGVNACVVVLGGAFESVAYDPLDPLTVIAGGAVKLPVLARKTAAMGLSGLEWAVGVPGSVGGGVRMNAGGHGSDIAANIVSATLVRSTQNAELQEVPAGQLGLGYRTSAIESGDVVVSATFRLATGTVEKGEAELKAIVRWRREHQPGGANCGSVFSNPAGDSAGRLIDSCSLKGHRIGSATVSEKHANFIQADPNAKADDISALIVFVQSTVRDRFGVELHPEVQTLGIHSLQRSKTVSPTENHR